MSSAQTKPKARPKLAKSTEESAAGKRIRLTPEWAGRDISEEDFENADYQEGWCYELINGRVEVLPTPDPPHDAVVEWLRKRLFAYRDAHPTVVNYITSGCRVFIPRRRAATWPHLDLAAFRDFPTRWPPQVRSWREVNPLLVVEVISPRYANKDLDRNVTLYGEAPSVREYWIFDPRDRTGRLTMRVYRKRGARSWQRPIDVPFGGAYTTPLLPDFTLTVDPTA